MARLVFGDYVWPGLLPRQPWPWAVRRSSCLAVAADGTQQVQSFGQRELLAYERGYEAAAADFAARFHTAQYDEQISPSGGQRLAVRDVAEHYPPAPQQLMSESFGITIRRRLGVADESPAAWGVPGTSRAAAACTSAALGIE